MIDFDYNRKPPALKGIPNKRLGWVFGKKMKREFYALLS
jgi:hypothetical protein